MSTPNFPPPWLADAAAQATPLSDAVRVDGEGSTRRLVATRTLPARTAYLTPALAVGTRAGLVRAVGGDQALWGRVLAAVGADDASAADPPLWSLALPAGLAGTASRPDAAWCLPPVEVAAARHAESAVAACIAVSLDGGQSPPSAICLFVSRDVAAGEEVTLDWAPAGPRSVQRAAAVLARLPAARWAVAAERKALADAVAAAVSRPLPGVAPAATPPRSDAAPPPAEAKPPVSVWTDYPVLREWLDGHESSVFTRNADRAAAAIVVSPHPLRHDTGSTQRTNQFPYEAALIRKDLLPATLRGFWARLGDEERAHFQKLFGTAADAAHPPFFPPAYDLASEAHWALAAAAAETDPGAAWVIKPATASRAVGITATRLPATLAAFRSAAGGDRVVQRCITQPATYQGRKFDLRVIVAVRSFTPPSAVLYTGWHARVASAKHDAAAVTERGSLVTVSCYDDDEEESDGGHTAHQLMLPRHDVDAALKQRGWSPAALAAAIAALAASVVRAGGGAIGAWPRSGAWYGLDVMLTEGAFVNDDDGASFPAPRLLEVNFAPDLKTAAAFRPALPGELLSAVFGGAAVGAGLDGDAWRELF